MMGGDVEESVAVEDGLEEVVEDWEDVGVVWSWGVSRTSPGILCCVCV